MTRENKLALRQPIERITLKKTPLFLDLKRSKKCLSLIEEPLKSNVGYAGLYP
jgi:hypothetical protein